MSKERFLELAKETEKEQKALKAKYAELKAVMEELKVDTMVQDPETLAVYKIIVPNGTFTEFRTIDYKRTALEGERGGTVLAKSEAEAAGFTLKSKEK